MKTLLTGKGYWDIVVAGYSDPTDWSALSANAKTK